MTILKAGSVPTERGGQDDPRGEYTAQRLSDAGGLSQFGALIEELSPGASSSYAHWHAKEDEMIYVLSGTPAVEEDGVETLLSPGDAVCWKAGEPVAHRLINRGEAPARYMIIGTRATRECVTYPAHDRVLCTDRTDATRFFTTLAGEPAQEIAP